MEAINGREPTSILDVVTIGAGEQYVSVWLASNALAVDAYPASRLGSQIVLLYYVVFIVSCVPLDACQLD